MRILVVDDTRIILSVTEAILTQERHEVFTAANGGEGYAVFGDVRPDMVITDIEMPWQDGLSMMQLIRQTHPHVYTIYMTGNPGPYQRCLDAERDTYQASVVYKPFTRSDLLQAVTEVVMQPSPSRRALHPGNPLGSVDPTSYPPENRCLASLSAASFRRERGYEKIDRMVGLGSYLDASPAGGRG
ncbi:MAG: response regulator [Desulfobacterales bacterium]|jgi:CheY-like chemotaxis protein